MRETQHHNTNHRHGFLRGRITLQVSILYKVTIHVHISLVVCMYIYYLCIFSSNTYIYIYKYRYMGTVRCKSKQGNTTNMNISLFNEKRATQVVFKPMSDRN